jgi:hypothetical protein
MKAITRLLQGQIQLTGVLRSETEELGERENGVLRARTAHDTNEGSRIAAVLIYVELLSFSMLAHD